MWHYSQTKITTHSHPRSAYRKKSKILHLASKTLIIWPLLICPLLSPSMPFFGIIFMLWEPKQLETTLTSNTDLAVIAMSHLWACFSVALAAMPLRPALHLATATVFEDTSEALFSSRILFNYPFMQCALLLLYASVVHCTASLLIHLVHGEVLLQSFLDS